MNVRNGSTVDVMRQAQTDVNSANEVTETGEVVYGTVSGRMRALRGRELEQASQIKATISYRFDCRQCGIQSGYWLCEYGTGRSYNVEAVVEDERRIDATVFCSLRVAE